MSRRGGARWDALPSGARIAASYGERARGERARAPAREAAAELPLPRPRQPATAPKPLAMRPKTASEMEGQAACHAYVTRVLGPGCYARSVPNGIPVTARDEAERRRLIRINAAWTRAGMRKGTPDYEVIRDRRPHLIEFKAAGATLGDLSDEQEDEILAALAAGARVGLAHADPYEVEELLLIWGFDLRFRLPPRAPDAAKRRGLRWPLEGDALREAILAPRRERNARAEGVAVPPVRTAPLRTAAKGGGAGHETARGRGAPRAAKSSAGDTDDLGKGGARQVPRPARRPKGINGLFGGRHGVKTKR